MNHLLYSTLILLSFILFSCESNGPTLTKTIQVGNFSKVIVYDAIDANIYEGDIMVKMTGSDNLIEKLDIYTLNNTLHVKMKQGIYDNNLVADIYVPGVELVQMAGSGKIFVDEFAGQADLELSMTGTGIIQTTTINLSNRLTCSITGSGNIRPMGFAPFLNISIPNSGNVEAYDFPVTECTVDISGGGNASVDVSNQLNVTIPGNGNVYYKGMPNITSHITGGGMLINEN